jgi:hypothetical protein
MLPSTTHAACSSQQIYCWRVRCSGCGLGFGLREWWWRPAHSCGRASADGPLFWPATLGRRSVRFCGLAAGFLADSRLPLFAPRFSDAGRAVGAAGCGRVAVASLVAARGETQSISELARRIPSCLHACSASCRSWTPFCLRTSTAPWRSPPRPCNWYGSPLRLPMLTRASSLPAFRQVDSAQEGFCQQGKRQRQR